MSDYTVIDMAWIKTQVKAAISGYFRPIVWLYRLIAPRGDRRGN